MYTPAKIFSPVKGVVKGDVKEIPPASEIVTWADLVVTWYPWKAGCVCLYA